MIFMNSTEVVARCAELASRAHTLYSIDKKHSTRKDGVTPFIVHPARVAAIVDKSGSIYQAVGAAWLHDVLEDTLVSHDNIMNELTAKGVNKADINSILNLVNVLTKDPTKDRYGKLDSTVYKISCMPLQFQYYAITIKLADLIDNLTVLDGVTPSFIIRHYIPETEYLVSKLHQLPAGANTKLENQLSKLIERRKKDYGIWKSDN